MISTDKKIEVMSQYKEGANILLKRVGAQHWSNPAIKNTIQFNWSTNDYKTKKDFRSHHDYIEPLDFINFINTLPFDVDIMLEAKAKDEALFRLTRQLKYYDFKFLDETSFERKVNHNK